MHKRLIDLGGVLALSFSVYVQAEADMSREAIVQRIAPVGKVCIHGQACPVDDVQAPVEEKPSGRAAEQVVSATCHGCHSVGVLGAPKIGDKAAWSARAKARGGLDGLLATTISGINAMPPKGACFDCSKDELRSAIMYMSGLE
ncbi:cytochrome c5 [Pseudomonas duriflava]|uniref:Cytochrome c5 n=1 Tax=Pseudomonas duriflava TaxID=459528 RepID=A0A562QIQ5_9PSED|nr:c-type cytochrome [Pseudomonas duriflava]TWI56648.1 cytochrome c5 [Pseudomonas duriflava]